MPANLSAEAPLLDLVAEIGRRSRTFQRQCVLIDRTRGLIVRLREAGPRGDRPYVARTVIRRHEFGAITASIELYAPQDPAEIVAHEFEHLIEQIEGVNLRLMSLVAWSGVRVTTDGSYETERAVMAGRQVAREYGSTRPAGVTPIETTY